MRMQQFEILERMIPLAASLSWTYEQADMIADVVENIGNAISPEYWRYFLKAASRNEGII